MLGLGLGTFSLQFLFLVGSIFLWETVENCYLVLWEFFVVKLCVFSIDGKKSRS